ncbi:MAG TPA: hypothetical protein DCL86_15010, partial [Bacteroidales bacterium]|nr:hypothetical protein [Bacteroidales bacterium]
IAFKVTQDGIVMQPVISYAGTLYVFVEGYMKISSDGNWLGVGNTTFTELFHFDNTSGMVSDQGIVSIPKAANGVEFSPDNSKFYANGGYQYFFQYDLSSNDPVEIQASAVLLSNEVFVQGALQLGPDGKIYVGHSGEYLGVIHDPDKKGLLCNYEFNSVYLEGRTYAFGLPVFMQSYLRNPEFHTTQYCMGMPTQFNIA